MARTKNEQREYQRGYNRAGQFRIKKSYQDGHVGIRVVLTAHGWKDDTIKVEGSADVSSSQARELAKALIEEADRVDAKVAAKEASEERRRKWREREIASGRMRVIGMRELVNGSR